MTSQVRRRPDGDYELVVQSKKYGTQKALIDEEVSGIVAGYEWVAEVDSSGVKFGTVIGNSKKLLVWLHNVLTGVELCQDEYAVEYADGNSRNLKIQNLRKVLARESIIPRVKSVFFDGRQNKWVVRVKVGRRVLTWGKFDTEEAARASEPDVREMAARPLRF